MQCERKGKNCCVEVQEVTVMLDISHGSEETTNLDALQFHKVSAQWSLQKRLLD